ncbi:MAG TPA: crossover junction endodeoxyribonuclease RuvC [Rhodanobacteraceae bacterium]|nr:crossover junction endodeoxyribonuclease RuvC [Rhodanobacteraceae bacterium]
MSIETPSPATGSRPPATGCIRILGIDPGSLRTGVGVIEAGADGKLRCLLHTTLHVGGDDDFPQRLARIYDGLSAIIDEHRPQEVAIERVFMAKNADSALKLGQARGAAICAAVGRALAVHEYAPTAIKQAVVGGGRADKSQVQHMVGVLLGLRDALQADAADALAVAITHAHTRAGVQRIGLPATAWRRRR